MGMSIRAGTRAHALSRPLAGPARSRERGMSMAEVMIAMVIIAVALLALMSFINSSGQMQDDSRERTLAYNAARQKIEDMRQLITPKTIYSFYNSIQAASWFRVDDLPAGVGPNRPSLTDPTQPSIPAQGRILFPDAGLGGGVLEVLSTDGQLQKALGLPKDLNGDGTITKDTVTIDQILILPVMIRIEWRNHNGRTSKVEVVTFITSK